MNEPKPRYAVRFPGEQVDDRPAVVYTTATWRDRVEPLVYADVVERNPIKPGESRFQYIVRLSEIARGEYEKVKPGAK